MSNVPAGPEGGLSADKSRSTPKSTAQGSTPTTARSLNLNTAKDRVASSHRSTARVFSPSQKAKDQMQPAPSQPVSSQPPVSKPAGSTPPAATRAAAVSRPDPYDFVDHVPSPSPRKRKDRMQPASSQLSSSQPAASRPPPSTQPASSRVAAAARAQPKDTLDAEAQRQQIEAQRRRIDSLESSPRATGLTPPPNKLNGHASPKSAVKPAGNPPRTATAPLGVFDRHTGADQHAAPRPANPVSNPTTSARASQPDAVAPIPIPNSTGSSEYHWPSTSHFSAWMLKRDSLFQAGL